MIATQPDETSHAIPPDEMQALFLKRHHNLQMAPCAMLGNEGEKIQRRDENEYVTTRSCHAPPVRNVGKGGVETTSLAVNANLLFSFAHLIVIFIGAVLVRSLIALVVGHVLIGITTSELFIVVTIDPEFSVIVLLYMPYG